MKMRLWLSAIVLGAALGVGAGWAITSYTTGPGGEDQKFGPWTTTTAVGESEQSPYSRARVAIYGIWGLPPAEVVYFSAREDDEGAPLDPACTYQVRGGPLPTRWWSVTLYEDGFYINNPANRYSWTTSDVAYEPRGDINGAWTLTVSPDGEGPNELAFGPGGGNRVLLLRLYQPNSGVPENRGAVALPSITRQSCAGAR